MVLVAHYSPYVCGERKVLRSDINARAEQATHRYAHKLRPSSEQAHSAWTHLRNTCARLSFAPDSRIVFGKGKSPGLTEIGHQRVRESLVIKRKFSPLETNFDP